MFSGRILLLTLLLVLSFKSGHAHSATGENHATTTTNSSGSRELGYSTLESLYQGNKQFRNAAGRKRAAVARMVEECELYLAP
jgi:hypothetical protein